MTRRVVFVSSELPPAVPGGAGSVVAGLASGLAEAGGAVSVVLAADAPPPDAPWPVVVAVPDPDAIDGAFLARSRSAAEAVATVVAGPHPDLVEFQDFDGLAFWALSHRHSLGLETVPIAVRVHGPVDMMTEAMGRDAPDLRQAAQMEREAFAMADLIIAPSAPLAAVVTERYGLDPDRVRIGPPPVPDLHVAPHSRGAAPEFVAYGRLGEVKGSHDFLAAALIVAERRADVRFRFIGPDGWSLSEGISMEGWLRSRIPSEHSGRFTFEGEVPRDHLAGALENAWAVVVPSRFETFCLAAHEVRRLGVPLVAPDLPAFRGFFSEQTGAEIYDGSPSDLAAVLERLADDPALVDRLAAAPPPSVGDPLAVYREPPPAPRHPRSQAGLATAGVHRVADAAPAAAAGSRGRVARSALRFLPAWAARLAVRVLPQGVKDRFRDVADWRVEAARRAADERRRAVMERIASGAFPDLTDPDVTVVIPCFNQGEFLEDALVSVFEQSFDSFEVIVVDDGSTDPATIGILDALDWPRTRLVRQANRGLPGARNAGMRIARGSFLVPLDADDELAPEFLATLHDRLAAEPGAAYAHCWAELFGDVEGTWIVRPFNPYLLTTSNSVVGCVLLRRTAWEQVGGYDETLLSGNEDWDLWLRLLEAGWEQVQVRKPLFRYRQHGVSMSVTTEARFEAARTEIAARHPDLYTPEAMRLHKAEWYPLVSVLVTAGHTPGLAAQTPADVEVVPLGAPDAATTAICRERGWMLRPAADRLSDGVRSARGKFVVAWDEVAAASPNALAELAAALETAKTEAAAVPAGSARPLLWRRWALVDPDSGLAGSLQADADLTPAAPPAEQLASGCCPLTEWTTTGAPPDNPVLRQDPEGDGLLPAWLPETQ